MRRLRRRSRFGDFDLRRLDVRRFGRDVGLGRRNGRDFRSRRRFSPGGRLRGYRPGRRHDEDQGQAETAFRPGRARVRLHAFLGILSALPQTWNHARQDAVAVEELVFQRRPDVQDHEDDRAPGHGGVRAHGRKGHSPSRLRRQFGHPRQVRDGKQAEPAGRHLQCPVLRHSPAGRDIQPPRQRQTQHQGVEGRMGRMGGEGLPPLHPRGQGRRPMRQPPDDPHQGQGQNQKADRLVELEQAVGCGLAPRLFDSGGHPPPHRDHGQDAERDHPVQGDGDGGIAAGGHRALRIRTQAAPAASAIAVRGSKTALYTRSG